MATSSCNLGAALSSTTDNNTMRSQPAGADRDQLLAQVVPIVRAILRRKSGMTLSESDTRRDNIDAIELYHDVLARLWERIALGESNTDAVADLKGYAAAVTYNAWSDHLREKYPRRASLKNRLRYFLAHQPKYAVSESADGEIVGGLRKWLLHGGVAPATRVAELLDGRERLPAGCVPRKAMEQCTADDWDRLLDALFTKLGGPVGLDDLVALTARLIGLKEDRIESLDEGDDDDDERADDTEDTQTLTPDRQAELNSALRQLWSAVCKLKTDYRYAYLLNIPGPGKSRGDIEVFALHGIASIAEIGERLALSDSQYQTIAELVGLDADDAAELARATGSQARFYVLWKYLPLADSVIARLLGLEQQQVINRRMLAMRELARTLRGDAPAKSDARTTPVAGSR